MITLFIPSLLYSRLKQLLECAEDMEIDIPHVWKYFGELIGPLILDNVLSLQLLSDCIVSLILNKTKQAKLIAEILLNASKESVSIACLLRY